jgi:hypothetical protein
VTRGENKEHGCNFVNKSHQYVGCACVRACGRYEENLHTRGLVHNDAHFILTGLDVDVVVLPSSKRNSAQVRVCVSQLGDGLIARSTSPILVAGASAIGLASTMARTSIGASV